MLLPDCSIRPVAFHEIPVLEMLIAKSTRALTKEDYTPEQIEAAIAYVFGVDSELVADKTYYAVLNENEEYLACGGWSKRQTLFGGDHYAGRRSGLLDPKKDPAKIRAFFVHPEHARKGIGARLLAYCETQARQNGFNSAELMATPCGRKLYQRYGYVGDQLEEFQQLNGVKIPFIPMHKPLI